MRESHSLPLAVASRCVILTGASRGLGAGLAQVALSQELPTNLLTLSRHPNTALEAPSPHKLEQWAVDLSKPDTVANRLSRWLDAQLTDACHQLLLINNAAVLAPSVPLAECLPHDLAQVLSTGLHAPMLLSSVFLQCVAQARQRGWAGDARLLNISSGLGRRAMASHSPYCAAKAGLDHFSRCIALEQQAYPAPVKVVSLAPGVIDTDMQVQLRSGHRAQFPDITHFIALHESQQLTSAHHTAQRIWRYMLSDSFGENIVDDIRQYAQ